MAFLSQPMERTVCDEEAAMYSRQILYRNRCGSMWNPSRGFNRLGAVGLGVISKHFHKGALDAMSESRCGPFAATPIVLKMET